MLQFIDKLAISCNLLHAAATLARSHRLLSPLLLYDLAHLPSSKTVLLPPTHIYYQPRNLIVSIVITTFSLSRSCTSWTFKKHYLCSSWAKQDSCWEFKVRLSYLANNPSRNQSLSRFTHCKCDLDQLRATIMVSHLRRLVISSSLTHSKF